MPTHLRSDDLSDRLAVRVRLVAGARNLGRQAGRTAHLLFREGFGSDLCRWWAHG